MKFTIQIIALGVLLASGTDAWAQGRGGFGRGGRGFNSRITLAGNEAVQEDLGVDEAAAAKLESLGDDMRRDFTQRIDALGGQSALQALPEAERNEKFSAISKELTDLYESKLAEVLNAEQMGRLDQILLQTQGAQALDREDVAGKLAITPEQKEKLAALSKDYGDRRQELFSQQGGDFQERFAKLRELGESHVKDALAVLTDEQKATLEELKGKAFDLSQLRRRRGNRPQQ